MFAESVLCRRVTEYAACTCIDFKKKQDMLFSGIAVVAAGWIGGMILHVWSYLWSHFLARPPPEAPPATAAPKADGSFRLDFKAPLSFLLLS